MTMSKLSASLSIMMGLGCLTYPAIAQSTAAKELAATAAILDVQRQTSRYQSQTLLSKALDARSRGRLADALELACHANAADPSNPTAKSLKEDLQTLIVGTDSSMMSRQLERISIQGQIQSRKAAITSPSSPPIANVGETSKNTGKSDSMPENKSEILKKSEISRVPGAADQAIIQRQRIIQERMAMEFQNQLNDADERMIPYRELVNYPDDWVNRAEIRDRESSEMRQPIGQ
jgi:hypothetical protein